jgi:hypothetical protein
MGELYVFPHSPKPATNHQSSYFEPLGHPASDYARSRCSTLGWGTDQR